MRSLVHIFAFLAVIGLAFWAYQENYRTQATIGEVRQLHRDIGAAHARINVLEAEWAYLNRPDRLRELADLNFERLGLLPLSARNFGQVEDVVYPIRPLGVITEPVDVSSDMIDEENPL